MILNTAQVESMLRANFLKRELELLQASPPFMDALPLVKDGDQYKQLCEFSEELLGTHEHAHRSAQQFRRDARRSC